MKVKILILTLVSVSMFAVAQQKETNFTIQGNIVDLKIPYLYLSIGRKRDSIPVENGKFSYKGNADEPLYCYLSYGRPFGQGFFVEKGNIEVKGHANALGDIQINGGKIQQEWNILEKDRKVLRAEIRDLSRKFTLANNALDLPARSIVENQMDQVNAKINAIGKAFIVNNPKSYVSLSEIRNLQYSNPEYQDYATLYDKLDPSLKKTKIALEIENTLELLKRSAIGQKMKDFTQNDPSGKPINLSSFRGKYVLVDFWAAWCGPCREENPNVLKVYQQFSDKAFAILGVSLDSSEEKWKKAIEADKLPWTQVSDLKGWRNEVSVYFGIRAIPANFLIDPNGTIIAKNLMGEDLDNKIKELLGKN